MALAGSPGGGHALAVSGTPAAARGSAGLVSAPFIPAPVVSAPVSPAPVSPAPFIPAPVGSAPVSPAPVSPAPVGSAHVAVTQKALWKATRAPLPAGAAGAYLAGVACPSITVCVAAGSYTDSSTQSDGLLVTRHGPSWTSVRAPLPAGAAAAPQVALSSVACPSVTVCVAAGSYTDASGKSQGVLLTGLGTRWKAAKAPLPAGAVASSGVSFSGLACPSVTGCVAVGYYLGPAGNEQGLLLTGLGSRWIAAKVPLPAGAAATTTEVPLSGVACPSAVVCVVTGRYINASGGSEGLLLTGLGSRWITAKAPLPAGAASSWVGLNGLTCPSITACVVTGGAIARSSGVGQGLLLTGHRSSWSAVKAPLATGAYADVSLFDVACPSARVCVVAGDSTTGRSPHVPTEGLLLTGHGSSWSAVIAPTPPEPPGAAGSGGLDGIACARAGACVVTGRYSDSSGDPQEMLLTGLERWTAADRPCPPTPHIPATVPSRPVQTSRASRARRPPSAWPPAATPIHRAGGKDCC